MTFAASIAMRMVDPNFNFFQPVRQNLTAVSDHRYNHPFHGIGAALGRKKSGGLILANVRIAIHTAPDWRGAVIIKIVLGKIALIQTDVLKGQCQQPFHPVHCQRRCLGL